MYLCINCRSSSDDEEPWVQPSVDTRPLVVLNTAALVYADIMKTKLYTPKTQDELVNEWCSCEAPCSMILSKEDIIRTRGGFVQSSSETPTRDRLVQSVVLFIVNRLNHASCAIAKDLGAVAVDKRIYGKQMCCEKFLDLLAVPYHEYADICRHIRDGDPLVANRLGYGGLLSDRTCRAIARIAVDSSLHGQYNPLDASLMLNRGQSKNHYLRTNAVGARLSEKHLNDWVGVTLKRRGVDSFMRCDVCVTLTLNHKKLDYLLRAVNGSVRKRNPKTSGYTATTHVQRVVSKRKAVLFDLIGCYKKKQKELAKARGVEPSAIALSDCVPDEDVKTENFCMLLNKRANKCKVAIEISPADVVLSELMDLDEDSIDLYISGFLGEDFSVNPVDQDGVDEDETSNVASPVTVSGDDADTGVDLQTSLASACRRLCGSETAKNRRRLGLVTALERLVSLRRFHHEHVVAERVLTYAAFRTGAKNSLSVLCFAADGVSKDKCKLPNKERGKNDETVNRLDCFVTGLQMSVPIGDPVALKSHERESENRLRREAQILREEIRKNPEAFSDKVKNANDDIINEFADKDISAASGFTLRNHDFMYPFGWGGPPKTDALISNILHVLRSEHVSFVPSCIAVVLDNASVNKSIFTLRAFGLILELIPRLREVHLMFPTVGHTHNSVDAHFGALCKKMRQADIGTPHDLAALMETLKNTYAHLDFDYYEFAKGIGAASGAFDFEYLSHQHYFLIYKDNNEDIRFSANAFLRFAEPLSERVNHLLTKCRELVPLTDAQKESGCYLFVPGQSGRSRRAAFAKNGMPMARDAAFFKSNSDELYRQLEIAGIDTEERRRDLASFTSPDVQAEDPVSLYEACRLINLKSPVLASVKDEIGTQQEMAIAQHLQMRGRLPRSSEMAIAVNLAIDKARENLSKAVVEVLLEGDTNGRMRSYILQRLRDNARRRGANDFGFLIRDIELRKYIVPFHIVPPIKKPSRKNPARLAVQSTVKASTSSVVTRAKKREMEDSSKPSKKRKLVKPANKNSAGDENAGKVNEKPSEKDGDDSDEF